MRLSMYRYFGGTKIYKRDRFFTNKRDAESAAKRIRKDANLVRITKTTSPNGYYLWVRVVSSIYR